MQIIMNCFPVPPPPTFSEILDPPVLPIYYTINLASLEFIFYRIHRVSPIFLSSALGM